MADQNKVSRLLKTAAGQLVGILKMVEEGFVPPMREPVLVAGREVQGMVLAEMLNMKSGNYITPHMEHIAKKIAFVMSGGDVIQGTRIPEEQWMRQEREAFVDLWRTENTQKMADHILATGKPLMI